jgi:hypothetical protein
MGTRGVRRSAGPRCSRAPVERLQRLPLVPRDGGGEFLRPRAGAFPQRALRRREGRQGRATRGGRVLHGRSRADDGRGWLAAATPCSSPTAARSRRRSTCRRIRGTGFRRSGSGSKVPCRRGSAIARDWSTGRQRRPCVAWATSAARSTRSCPRTGSTWGGGGDGPRFPQAPRLELLLAARDRADARSAAVHLLDTLDASGVHDHLGGGFHRYAVEEDWVVPHFEKLLVDNAQLAGVYLRAYAAFGIERYRTVARRTLGYLLDLRTEAGTFAASDSAIDPNGEGAFYTWTPAELRTVLGADRGALACRAFGVGEWGNHEGRSVLVRKSDPSVVAAIRGPLLEARGRRPRPQRDDKCVVAWNALAIEALVRAGDVLGEPALTAAALDAAARIASLQGADGALPRYRPVAHRASSTTTRRGRSRVSGCTHRRVRRTGWGALASRDEQSSSGSCRTGRSSRRRERGAARGPRARRGRRGPVRRGHGAPRAHGARGNGRRRDRGNRCAPRSCGGARRRRARGRRTDARAGRGDSSPDRRRVDGRTAPSCRPRAPIARTSSSPRAPVPEFSVFEGRGDGARVRVHGAAMSAAHGRRRSARGLAPRDCGLSAPPEVNMRWLILL